METIDIAEMSSVPTLFTEPPSAMLRSPVAYAPKLQRLSAAKASGDGPRTGKSGETIIHPSTHPLDWPGLRE